MFVKRRRRNFSNFFSFSFVWNFGEVAGIIGDKNKRKKKNQRQTKHLKLPTGISFSLLLFLSFLFSVLLK